jgi:hypothetical protein
MSQQSNEKADSGEPRSKSGIYVRLSWAREANVRISFGFSHQRASVIQRRADPNKRGPMLCAMTKVGFNLKPVFAISL